MFGNAVDVTLPSREVTLKSLLRRARSVLATALVDDVKSIQSPSRPDVLNRLIMEIDRALGDTLPRRWEDFGDGSS
jgi:hypothetical protein